MKRPSYRAAVEWIARNDNAGQDTAAPAKYAQSRESVAAYISTVLVADLFDMPVQRVADDVMRKREQIGAENL